MSSRIKMRMNQGVLDGVEDSAVRARRFELHGSHESGNFPGHFSDYSDMNISQEMRVDSA